MYKIIRNIIVAFVIWFMLAYILTAILASMVYWSNYFNIYLWGAEERALYIGSFIFVGYLVFKNKGE